nr:Unknown Function [uncultured bacterium]
MFLQRLHMLADGGVGDVELNRRAGKTEMPGGCFKGP